MTEVVPSTNPTCRICHENGGVRLFSPCACSGSIKFVHDQCQRAWFLSRPSPLHPSKWKCNVCQQKISLDLSVSRRIHRSVLSYLGTRIAPFVKMVAMSKASIHLTLHVIMPITLRQIWSITALSAHESAVLELLEGTTYSSAMRTRCIALVCSALYYLSFRSSFAVSKPYHTLHKQQPSFIFLFVGTFLFSTTEIPGQRKKTGRAREGAILHGGRCARRLGASS